MSSKLQFWTTSIIALIGAGAWIPHIVSWCKPGSIVGKMISRDSNLNVDKSRTFYFFKLSILSKNKPFNLKRIKCQIEDMDGEKSLASAGNWRRIIFTSPEGIQQKLLVPRDEFLNNLSFFPPNKNVVGYLFFTFDGNLDRKICSTTFIFESFENKIRKLKFKESDIHGEELFYDDTIRQMVDSKEIQNHPAIRPLD